MFLACIVAETPLAGVWFRRCWDSNTIHILPDAYIHPKAYLLPEVIKHDFWTQVFLPRRDFLTPTET